MFHQFIPTLLNILFPPACRHCRAEGVWLCRNCLKQPQSIVIKRPTETINALYCLGTYDHPVLQTAVRELKYHGGRVVSEPLADELSRRFGIRLRQAGIIPVPLHPRRQRTRGFNQSELLAKRMAQTIGLPVSPAVQRVKYTVSQVNLDEQARQSNVRQAFRLNPKLVDVPKTAIIVDDVFTTGATISEVAAVLRSAGTTHVIAITIAKG